MVSYKLNPEVGKIQSPITLIWNGYSGNSEASAVKTAEEQRWNFSDGKTASEAVFDKHFNIIGYKAVEGTVEITVYEFMEPARR